MVYHKAQEKLKSFPRHCLQIFSNFQRKSQGQIQGRGMEGSLDPSTAKERVAARYTALPHSSPGRKNATISQGPFGPCMAARETSPLHPIYRSCQVIQPRKRKTEQASLQKQPPMGQRTGRQLSNLCLLLLKQAALPILLQEPDLGGLAFSCKYCCHSNMRGLLRRAWSRFILRVAGCRRTQCPAHLSFLFQEDGLCYTARRERKHLLHMLGKPIFMLFF